MSGVCLQGSAAVIDQENGTVFVYLQPLTQPLWKTAAVSMPEDAYVFGGLSGTGVIADSVLKFEPSVPKVTSLASKLPAPLHSASAVWAGGDTAYIFGGVTASGNSDQIVRYQGQATILGTVLPTARMETSAVWTGSAAYIFGGFDSDESDDIVRFDPVAGTAVVLPEKLPTPRTRTSAVWTGAEVLIFGGNDGSGPLQEILSYNPLTGTVIKLRERLPRPLEATAAVWTGERAIVLGGRNDVEASRDVYIYDPVHGPLLSFSNELDGRRESPSAVWSRDHVDFFGGRNNTAVSKWIMRFTPEPRLSAPDAP